MSVIRLLHRPFSTPFLALMLAFAAPMPLVAQDAPAADAPATDAAPGGMPAIQFDPGEELPADGDAPDGAQTDDGIGAAYVAETTGDWQVRCVRTGDGFDPCQLFQLLRDESDNPVAEITIVALPDGAETAAGATIITPLETLLKEQVTLIVDGGKSKRYPFVWCERVGCVALAGLTNAEVAQLKKGAKGTIVVVPVAAPDQKVSLTMSLSGFTAGFDKMKAMNAETQQRALAAQKAAADASATDGEAKNGEAKDGEANGGVAGSAAN